MNITYTNNWPIYFFVAVSFWNLLGAGVFGFLINPPIALYYMQGLYARTHFNPITCTYGAFRSIRRAGNRLDAVLPAWFNQNEAMENKAA